MNRYRLPLSKRVNCMYEWPRYYIQRLVRAWRKIGEV